MIDKSTRVVCYFKSDDQREMSLDEYESMDRSERHNCRAVAILMTKAELRSMIDKYNEEVTCGISELKNAKEQHENQLNEIISEIEHKSQRYIGKPN